MENFFAIVGVILVLIAVASMTRSGRVALGLFNVRLGILIYRLAVVGIVVVFISMAWVEYIAPHIPQ